MRRRTALSTIAAAAAIPALPATLRAQARYDWHPTPTQNEPPHPLRRRLSTRRAWDIDTQLQILPAGRISSERSFDPRDPVSPRLFLDSTVITLPIAPATALAHPDPRTPPAGDATSETRPYAPTPRISTPYALGTTLAIYNAGRTTTTSIRVNLNNAIVAYDTEIDDARALRIPWPDTFTSENPDDDPDITLRNAEITSALQPQTFIQSDSPLITDRLAAWTNNDPRRLTPYALAKYLASRVFLQLQPDNKRFIDGREYFNTLRINTAELTEVDPLALEGLRVLGAEYAIQTKVASPFDFINLIVAMLRAAGIPARPVIGIDIQAQNGTDAEDTYPGDLNRIHAWLEFYLKHPDNTQGQWIPFDALRLRRRSERTPALDREWEFLGNLRNGRFFAPISCHWHPPTAVVSPGPPSLWGWIPDTPSGEVPAIEQRLIIRANPAEQRGDQPPIPTPTFP